MAILLASKTLFSLSVIGRTETRYRVNKREKQVASLEVVAREVLLDDPFDMVVFAAFIEKHFEVRRALPFSSERQCVLAMMKLWKEVVQLVELDDVFRCRR